MDKKDLFGAHSGLGELGSPEPEVVSRELDKFFRSLEDEKPSKNSSPDPDLHEGVVDQPDIG